jgi:hypothetical protein
LVLTLVTTVIGYMGLALTHFRFAANGGIFRPGVDIRWLTVVFFFHIGRNGAQSAVVNWCAISLGGGLLRLQPSGLWVGCSSPLFFWLVTTRCSR